MVRWALCSSSINDENRSARLLQEVRPGPVLPDIDPFEDQYIAALRRGDSENWYAPAGRGQRCSLWLSKGRVMRPVGMMACSCWGWLRGREYGILSMRHGQVIIERRGSDAHWSYNGKSIGTVEYGFWLRAVYFGSATLRTANKNVFQLRLPLLGPSNYQRRDCIGVLRRPGGEDIRILLNSRVVRGEREQVSDPSCDELARHNPGWGVPPPIGSTPLFPDGKQAICDLPKEDRIFLSGVALWATMFYRDCPG